MGCLAGPQSMYIQAKEAGILVTTSNEEGGKSLEGAWQQAYQDEQIASDGFCLNDCR